MPSLEHWANRNMTKNYKLRISAGACTEIQIWIPPSRSCLSIWMCTCECLYICLLECMYVYVYAFFFYQNWHTPLVLSPLGMLQIDYEIKLHIDSNVHGTIWVQGIYLSDWCWTSITVNSIWAIRCTERPFAYTEISKFSLLDSLRCLGCPPDPLW